MTKRISRFAVTAAAIVLVLAGCGSGPGTDRMEPEDTAPVFSDAAADQTYTVGMAIQSLTLPAATGGDGTLTYSLGPMIPAGLMFDGATRTLSGTPTTAGTYDMTYTVADADDNSDDTDTDTEEFTITVREAPTDTAPSFTGTVENQTYTVGEAIEALTLPDATGGNGALTYSLGPMIPDGLMFDGATRTLSGTPTTAGTYDMTYTVADADDNSDDTDTEEFTITVREPEPPAMADYVGTWYFAVPVTTILVFGEDTFTLTVGDGSPIGEAPYFDAVTRVAVAGTVAVNDITATTVTMELHPETVTIEPTPQLPLLALIIEAARGGVVATIDGDRMSVAGQVVVNMKLLLQLPPEVDLTACRDAPCVSS